MVSGQVWVGFGSSFGWIGVLNYTFRYFWVSFSLSGISGYFGYQLFFGGSEPNIKAFSNIY